MGAGSPDLNDVTNLLRSVRCAPPARAVQVLVVIPTRRFFWRPMGSSEPSGLVLGATGFVLPQPCEGHGRRDLVRDEPESHRFVWYIRMVGRVKNGLRTLIDWLIEGVAAR